MPLIRRLPKRGFNHRQRHPMSEVNLEALEKAFESGAEVTVEALVEKGLAKKRAGGVKVLGRGELTKKLTLKVNAISVGARSKIESAGGAVELIAAPVAKAVARRGKTS